ncbi:MAG: transposase, family [Flavipsychrobacter sp.]|nr:transposase, family [Flavipsychrobacter sp.]
MIRYTPQSQLTLEGFETPFLQHLDKDNRWVKLANSIPWDKLANIYYRKMNSDFGAPSLSARMVIGAVIIKHMLNIDDREVVAQIQENMYLQYLVGLSSFTTKEAFDPSLFVTIRYRLGQDVMEEFNQLVLQQAGVIASPSKDTAGNTSSSANENSSSDTCSDVDENTANNKEEQPIEPSTNIEHNNTTGDNNTLPANSGTLLLDATVAEQQIEYPTDLKLLNESRQQLERMIAQVCKDGKLRQPRMYKNKARQQYLTIAKKKKKTKKNIRKALRRQLQYVSRDMKYINKLLEQHTVLKAALNKRDWKLLQVIHEVHRQQQEMFTEDKRTIEHRIVSLYQPHVRPIPRGKDRVQTEFGSKQLVMLKDGFTHVQTISWDNFNEGIRLKECVEAYKEIYGCYPEKVSVDAIFGNKANRQYLKEKAIRFVGKQLGRPPKTSHAEKRTLQKEMAGRNEIEGKFGQGKNAYGLQKIKARMKETSESWIMCIYFILNLVKLSERAFLCLLKAMLHPHIEPVFSSPGSYRTGYKATSNDIIYFCNIKCA